MDDLPERVKVQKEAINIVGESLLRGAHGAHWRALIRHFHDKLEKYSLFETPRTTSICSPLHGSTREFFCSCYRLKSRGGEAVLGNVKNYRISDMRRC